MSGIKNVLQAPVISLMFHLHRKYAKHITQDFLGWNSEVVEEAKRIYKVANKVSFDEYQKVRFFTSHLCHFNYLEGVLPTQTFYFLVHKIFM